ncbi:hypothetical protein [Dickeya zeae]|uniref:hypothetical protein n=1 Tax=Dickeya zeae TaxID=204042 RepID=UPI00039EAD08|nr:hypothetical protein [Dickeya zeae]
MTYKTMQLDTSNWDLTLDGSGNLAIADGSYAVAQDVASACLVFSGECYYDNTLGVPWKEEVLGKRPTPGYVAQKMQTEAKKLPIVDQALASVFFDKNTRRMRGTIRVTDTDGNTAQVNL